MNEIIRALAVRVFTGGIICSAAMILAGDGAKKEIVRLCCACLMIVLILSPLKGASFNFSALKGEAEIAERQINEAVQRYREYERNAAAAAIGQYIESSAQKLGFDCEAVVEYFVDGENVFHISRVLVKMGEDGREAVAEIITRDCGAAFEQIIFEEAGNEN